MQTLEVAQIERAWRLDCNARDLNAQGRRYREILREPQVRCRANKQGVAQKCIGAYAVIAADVVSFNAEENTLLDLRCYRPRNPQRGLLQPDVAGEHMRPLRIVPKIERGEDAVLDKLLVSCDDELAAMVRDQFSLVVYARQWAPR